MSQSDAERIVVTVADDGIGMPATEIAARPFRPARPGGARRASGGRVQRRASRAARRAPDAADSVDGERMIRVLLVDDHAVVRTGFRLLLQSQAGDVGNR